MAVCVAAGLVLGGADAPLANGGADSAGVAMAVGVKSPMGVAAVSAGVAMATGRGGMGVAGTAMEAWSRVGSWSAEAIV